MKNVLIFGASGHGSVVLDILESEGSYNPIGFLDSFKPVGTKVNGYEVLGSETDLPRLMDAYGISGGIVAIGDNWSRKTVVGRIRATVPNFEFISAVHPSALIAKNVKIGEGSVLMPGVIVNSNARIGNFCILNTASSLDHDGKMEEYSSLAPKVCTGSHFLLGKYSAVCIGVNVVECVRIGEHTVVGAGSLVTRALPDRVVAYGSPARIIRRRQVGEPYLSGLRKAEVLTVPLSR